MSVVLLNPRMRARIVTAPKPSTWLTRFLSDCRDLWTLITKGHPEDDVHLPWRMAAELAKTPEIDLDAWEADMWERGGRNACWFDPARYDDTPYAFVKRPKRQTGQDHSAGLICVPGNSTILAGRYAIQNNGANNPYFNPYLLGS